MPEIFNPLDINKWRNLISEFDAKRVKFYETLEQLKKSRGATPELENRRQELIRKSTKINNDIGRLMKTATTVRNWMGNIGQQLGYTGSAAENLNEMGVAPVFLAIGVGGAALIVQGITSFLKEAVKYNHENERIRAGHGPSKPQKEQPELFGLKAGALKWVLGLGLLAVFGPMVMRQIEKRL